MYNLVTYEFKETFASQLIQAKASEILPLLAELSEKMKNCINLMTKSDIVELKAFKSPPSAVTMTAEAICILFSQKPSYDNFKKLVSSSDFIRLLNEFDLSRISDYCLEKLSSYMSNPDYTQEYQAKISRASSLLCAWSRYAYEYGKLYDSVSSFHLN